MDKNDGVDGKCMPMTDDGLELRQGTTIDGFCSSWRIGIVFYEEESGE